MRPLLETFASPNVFCGIGWRDARMDGFNNIFFTCILRYVPSERSYRSGCVVFGGAIATHVRITE
jgi:hypothetical protein